LASIVNGQDERLQSIHRLRHELHHQRHIMRGMAALRLAGRKK
jgi:hypothetical protein